MAEQYHDYGGADTSLYEQGSAYAWPEPEASTPVYNRPPRNIPTELIILAGRSATADQPERLSGAIAPPPEYLRPLQDEHRGWPVTLRPGETGATSHNSHRGMPEAQHAFRQYQSPDHLGVAVHWADRQFTKFENVVYGCGRLISRGARHVGESRGWQAINTRVIDPAVSAALYTLLVGGALAIGHIQNTPHYAGEALRAIGRTPGHVANLARAIRRTNMRGALSSIERKIANSPVGETLALGSAVYGLINDTPGYLISKYTPAPVKRGLYASHKWLYTQNSLTRRLIPEPEGYAVEQRTLALQQHVLASIARSQARHRRIDALGSPTVEQGSLNIRARLAGLITDEPRQTEDDLDEAAETDSALDISTTDEGTEAIAIVADATPAPESAADVIPSGQPGTESQRIVPADPEFWRLVRINAITDLVAIDMDDARRRGRHPVRDWPEERLGRHHTMSRETAVHIADRVIANLRLAQPELIERAEAILAERAAFHAQRAAAPRTSSNDWSYADRVPSSMRQATIEAQGRINLSTVASEALLTVHLLPDEIAYAADALTAGIYNLVRSEATDRITYNLMQGLSNSQRQQLARVDARIERYVYDMLADRAVILSAQAEADLTSTLLETIRTEADQLMQLVRQNVHDTNIDAVHEQLSALQLAEYCWIPQFNVRQRKARRAPKVQVEAHEAD